MTTASPLPLVSDQCLQHSTGTRLLKAGEVLFYEGEEGTQAYIIQSGLMEITRRVGSAEVLLATCEPGEIIGEMALIDQMPRSATVRALKPTEVRILPQQDFASLLETADPAVRLLLTRMAHIIRNLTESTVRLTLGLP